MNNRVIIPCLNLVLDDFYLQKEEFVPFADKILETQTVQLLQLRIKRHHTQDFYRIASDIREICEKYQVPLIINDRFDIAIATDAHGVHLGQTDIPYTIVREMIGPDKIIGLSVESLSQLAQLKEDQIDYLGVGSLFPTFTKGDAPLIGLSTLKEIKKNVKVPVIGIGGIDLSNIKQVLQHGANGVAIIGSILTHKNPVEMCKTLYRMMMDHHSY